MKIFLKLSACVAMAVAYGLMLVLHPFSPVTFGLGMFVCTWLANLFHKLGHLIAYLLLKLLHTRLSAILGSEADPILTQQTKFNGAGISVAYFCAICICAVMTALPFLSIMSYHFVNAAFAALGVLLAILYTYYFYTIRIRTQENQKRMIFSFLTVVTLPIGIFVLPLLEVRLLKAEQKEQPNTNMQ